VIGNAGYRNVPSLRNPINDANAIGERLHRLGFEVTRARDLDRRSMNETVDVFLARLTPGADVVVYFAGHGVEVQGANHLLPVDVPKLQYGQDRVLRSETTNLTDLMSDLRDKAPRALVMILDACRDNPFAGEGTRSIGSSRGLARVEPPKGSLVIYSAGVGERALDNLGEDDPSPNGLFTRTLLRQMDEEGSRSATSCAGCATRSARPRFAPAGTRRRRATTTSCSTASSSARSPRPIRTSRVASATPIRRPIPCP
jgi:hypothetical protein